MLKNRLNIILISLLLLCFGQHLQAQVFWTEDFQNSCSASCLATTYTGVNGTWTVTDNSPALDACGFATSPNVWYVSGAECGNAAGACGSSCSSTDPSLHIGSTTLGDLGASYDVGGWCLFGLAGLGQGTATDARAESPTIDCSGKSNITLNFDYIENGQGSTDNATLWYFDGSSWSQLADMPKTTICSSGQGLWTSYSISLPASADNNASVKIGFRWVNDDDGAGTDPSIAVDDITLSTPIVAPVTWLDFSGELRQNAVYLKWSTASEENNSYFTIQKSKDAHAFVNVTKVQGSGNTQTMHNYSAIDYSPYPGVSYYRLIQTDFNGKKDYCNKIVAIENNNLNTLKIYPNPSSGNDLNVLLKANYADNLLVKINSDIGQTIFTKTFHIKAGANDLLLQPKNYLTSGIYFVSFIYNGISVSKKWIVQH